MDQKKVLLVVASKGFQPREYNTPKNILEDYGYLVLTASNDPTVAIAKDGSQTSVDTTLDEVRVADYDAIFFIGGPGAIEHLDNEKSYRILREIRQAGKPFGAICIATRILAKAGVIEGVKVTGWDGDDKLGAILQEYGAIYQPGGAIVDQNVVTAIGPDSAEAFAEAIRGVLNR
ncbi:MAG: DJ-1/PfpI family protein [Candidatus Babeliales bacterium]